MHLAITIILLIIFILWGMPIVVAFGGALLYAVITMDLNIGALLPSGYSRLNTVVLLAIPLFILAGGLMQRGQLGIKLVQFINLFVGRFTGGLGAVGVIACGVFGAISGSAAATLSCIGSIMFPRLEEAGYSRGHAVSLIVCASPLGLLIPPSSIQILYAWSANQSILVCFLATVGPGVLLAALLCVVNWFLSRQAKIKDCHEEEQATGDSFVASVPELKPIAGDIVCAQKNGESAILAWLTVGTFIGGFIFAWLIYKIGVALEIPYLMSWPCLTLFLTCYYVPAGIILKRLFKKCPITKEAMPALLMPVIILGGIYSGLATPTEAAAVSVIYAIPVGFFIYKTLTVKDFFASLKESGVTCGVLMVMLLIVMVLSRVFVMQGLPKEIMTLFNSISSNKFTILLMINLFMILIGMLMDDVSGTLLSTPLLLPLVTAIGVSPIHFAAILGVNLGMGNITPPTAPLLYLGARLGDAKIKTMGKPTMYMLLGAWLPTLLITTYWPPLSLALPSLYVGKQLW